MKVTVWEQEIDIPTYLTGAPNKNPMFLERRVYQGSSGRVYPHSVIDKVYDQKVNKTYKALFLENKYLQIMVLPELGGRIQRALDKTNNYDFVYYNHVIKPALVGLCGPWISGGIEFNWPQHHRPSTFDPVDYKIMENEDGSCTIWVSEIENMFRTKGMAGFTLYPDKAYLEISARLYNRTNAAQTFLWWANPAIPANDYTQSIFPPDVYAVMDHGKRDVSSFPIATGTYYKMDYSKGVDISRYKNIPVPTSYMAYHSDFNFIGGYDYEKEAGILHVADHHVAPGKKQWTWGCGEFGQAWDRNLTDEDGPYIELMTGCFTDNQPDFSWLAPYEEKVFTQYFMPYKGVGAIKNATINGALNLEVEGDKVQIKAYTTAVYKGAKLRLCQKDQLLWEKTLDLAPEVAFEIEVTCLEAVQEDDLEVTLFDAYENILVAYKVLKKETKEIPEPAKAIPDPKEAKTNEDLYLYGLHLEQYRHATYEPEDYYLEGLKREPSDYRINTAYGKLLLSKGCFKESVPYFEAAIKKLTMLNPNSYDGEAFYQLGLALKYMKRYEKAYDYFYKATWNGAWQDASFYQLACLASLFGDFNTALEHIERAMVRNWHHMKARNLKTALLRKLGKKEEAKGLILETQKIDPLDFNSVWEERLLSETREEQECLKAQFIKLLHADFNTYIELALDYVEAGFYEEAKGILECFVNSQLKEGKLANEIYPLVYYHLGAIEAAQSKQEEAIKWFEKAAASKSNYCFPHRLEDIIALTYANALNPEDGLAYYYLGNLWYDKKQYEKAITAFERAKVLKEDFPTVHRNLALAYYNKKQEGMKAKEALERAFELDTSDARVFMELDQLYKKLGVGVEERLNLMKGHLELVEERDDLYLEYITLLNTLGYYEEARACLQGHNFHPWEGGEGKVPTQYVLCSTQIAKNLMDKGELKAAKTLLEALTGPYPHQLGEGKLAGAQENNIYFYLGMVLEKMGDKKQAQEAFEKASTGLSEPAGMMYYNDQPPETIFYQGLALLKLGKQDEAKRRFNKLIDYGEKHILDEVKIEYFAVSLPDLQIFDEDLNKKNKVHCLFMMGLGLLGLGERDAAEEKFNEVLTLDVSHIGARLFKA